MQATSLLQKLQTRHFFHHVLRVSVASHFLVNKLSLKFPDFCFIPWVSAARASQLLSTASDELLFTNKRPTPYDPSLWRPSPHFSNRSSFWFFQSIPSLAGCIASADTAKHSRSTVRTRTNSSRPPQEHTFKDGPFFYRLLEHEPFVKSAANWGGATSDSEPPQAVELGTRLRKLILAVYDEFLSEDGRHVDYQGIGKSEIFRR